MINTLLYTYRQVTVKLKKKTNSFVSENFVTIDQLELVMEVRGLGASLVFAFLLHFAHSQQVRNNIDNPGKKKNDKKKHYRSKTATIRVIGRTWQSSRIVFKMRRR